MGFESGESQTPPRAAAAQPQPLPRGNRTRQRKSDARSSSHFSTLPSDAGLTRLLCLKQPSSVSSTFPPGEGAAPPPGHSSVTRFPQLLSLSPSGLHLLMLPPRNASSASRNNDPSFSPKTLLPSLLNFLKENLNPQGRCSLMSHSLPSKLQSR